MDSFHAYKRKQFHTRAKAFSVSRFMGNPLQCGINLLYINWNGNKRISHVAWGIVICWSVLSVEQRISISDCGYYIN
jgi:hypothetical protein